MKAISLLLLLGFTSAFHLVTKDKADDEYYSSLINSMIVTAGDNKELSEDASKGVFADTMISSIGNELTREQEEEQEKIRQKKLQDDIRKKDEEATRHLRQQEEQRRQEATNNLQKQEALVQKAQVKEEKPSQRYAGSQSLSYVYAHRDENDE